MKFQDYYALLGVPRTASQDEIRKAYRKLALQWHPDRHKGAARTSAEERFKRISEAYEVLSDPATRGKYDTFGEHWKHGQEVPPDFGAGDAGGGARSQGARGGARGAGSGGTRRMTPEEFGRAFGGPGGFSDFFAHAFGPDYGRDVGGAGAGGRHARFKHRGADVRAELVLPVGEALAGGKRRFDVPALTACPRCGGVGSVGAHVCPRCVGVGTLRTDKTIELNIPPDVRDGQTLRLAGLGEPGDEGGAPGDLLLSIQITSDALHRVQGRDVEVDLPVAPWEAVFGASVDLRTPDGPVTLSVPPGSKAGARLRLRGKGLADGQGGRGDLYAVLRLTLPDTLDASQRELLAQLGRQSAGVHGGLRQERVP